MTNTTTTADITERIMTQEFWENIAAMGYTVAGKIIIILFIVIFAQFGIQLVNRLIGRIFDKTPFDPTLEKFVHKTAIMCLWLIMLGITLICLGVDVNAVVASFGVGSFIIGFSLKDTLNNLASGVMILLNKPFMLGDEVEVKGKTGIIKTISMSSITMVTKDNNKVTLPNSIVWGNPITNFTAYKHKKCN